MSRGRSADGELALNGGRPVRDRLLPYGRQWIDEEDIRAVVGVLRSDWITTGPMVSRFEEAFAEYVGARYAVSFSSGTGALHGAAHAAGLSPGAEAITTPLTFCPTANCVLYQGATPVFADVCRDTLTLDSAEIRRYISPRTKAILPMDYGGQPCDLRGMRELAEQNGLLVIEDACHALGATYQGSMVGSLSHMTVFSFHPVKHVTTGEGGMVTTSDPELARRLRVFRNHGIDGDGRQRQAEGKWWYEMIALGYNYRLSDIASALGLSQLRKMQYILSRRREIASRYTAALGTLEEVETPTVRPDCESAWHLYVVRLNLDRLRVGRGQILQALRAENIGVSVHYIPVPWHPYYQRLGYRKGQWPNAEDAYERILSLPLFPGMRDKDIEDVILACTKVIQAYRK
jgi:UDP-4-amino-4,6-dideoxy-N-acetyl-beta-L-altrosamine transaminase